MPNPWTCTPVRNSTCAMKATLPEYLKKQFLPYQLHWLNDPEPFKIGLWARQTGKDFTCAAEAVLDCVTHEKTHWLIIACGERQALESLEKVKHWVEAMHVVSESGSGSRSLDVDLAASEV